MPSRSITPALLVSCLQQRISVADYLNPRFVTISSDVLSQETQDLIYPICLQVLTQNRYYVRLFLKQYIQLIESHQQVPSESLYELYCDEAVLSAVENNASDSQIIEYNVSGFGSTAPISVKISETPRMLSGHGTTGARTWAAALYLSNYLNSDACPVDFANKKVCELGTGTGLVSLSILNNPQLHPSHVTLTDGSANLIENLQNNFELNNIDGIKEETVSTRQLLWGTTNPQNAQSFAQSVPEADILLGADVTYDSRILNDLCSTINDFFNHGNTKQAVIAATIRNEKTNDDWESQLRQWFANPTYSWSVVDRCDQPWNLTGPCWFPRDTGAIYIYSIEKRD